MAAYFKCGPPMLRKILICLLLIELTACATISSQGSGVVVSEKKLNHMTLEAGDKTIEAAKVGGKAGIIGGGVIGGVVGLMPGLMTGSPQGLVICSAAGAVIGAGVFGLTGGFLGGTVGYMGDLAVQNTPEYEFRVKSLNDSRILTIIQHSRAIPVNSRVLILEKNGKLFIKRA